MFKRVAFILLMAVMLLPLSAGAASLKSLYVQPAGDETAPSLQAVNLFQKNEKNYYLFMPAGADLTAMRVFFDGPDEIGLNGTMYKSGDPIVLEAGDFPFSWNGQKRGTLHVMQSANISSIFVTTDSGSVDEIHESKEVKEPGAVSVLQADGTTVHEGILDHIKTRGNTAFTYKKKAYQIKLDKKTDLLGLGKAKTFILVSNYIDITLLRNRIAYTAGLALGMEATSRCTHVDLYLNGDYYGNYLLCEKMEIGENRLDIEDLEKATENLNPQPLESYERFGRNSYKKATSKGYLIPNEPEDITGGYLVEMDLTSRYGNEVSGVVTQRGQPFVIKSPEYASEKQVAYIGQLLQELEDALFAKDGVNPQTGKHYYEYIDKESYVMKFLLEEVFKNYDSNRSSQFFYKPADSESTLLFAAPIWDFDQAMDNYGVQGANVFLASSSSTSYHWFPKAYRIDDFREAAIEMYEERLLPIIEALLGRGELAGAIPSIKEMQEEIRASAEMNYTRWGVIRTPERHTKCGRNFDEAVAYLERWFERRINNLETRWLSGDK